MSIRRSSSFPPVLVAATLLALGLGRPAFPQIHSAKVTGGAVQGVVRGAVASFKGIPFAAPPVGGRRWQAPAPVVPWQGVRAADRFGASCVQTIVQERKPWTYEFMTHNEIGEDCLTLNVWTTATSSGERRPVFFYIYGGGFSEGSAAVPVYDGEGLAKKGLVVVVANYRVGVLGFLAHPELTRESPARASGNYGLLDQIAALRWVRDNIAAFGGDAGRVTIAGQSAGGMSVHSLIASPLARGLFHRAIVQSGGSSLAGGRSRALGDAEADGVRFAEAKQARSIAELRAATWQTLMEPLPPPPSADGRSAAGTPLRFSPVVDGYVLPASPRDVVAQGRQNDVSTLTGANVGELGGLSGPQATVTVQSYVERARRQYGAMADEFLKLYPAGSDAEAAASQASSAREQALVSMYLWARERSKTARTRAFTYLWDHPLPGPDAARFGAFHSSEVPYVLGTLYASDRPFTEADHRIADMMSSYWANFAATGDPNGKGLVAWAPVGDAREVMEVGDKTGPVPLTADAARFAFWETFLTVPGVLRARGERIVDGQGREVLLRGMGLGGWMLQEGYMLGIKKEGTQHSVRARIADLVGQEETDRFYRLWRENHMTRADVDRLAASGFNSIRLPMHYNLFTLPIEEEPVEGRDTWLPAGFEMTDRLLDWCRANRMYLILDLHAAPGGQGKDANISDYDPAKPSLWESGENRRKTVALWRKLAERYANEPWIGGYDILNEPNWTFEDKDKNGREDVSNAPIWDLYKQITRAIREVDTNHIIIVEGNGWGNNYNGFPGPWDPNLVMSFHKYWNPNTEEAIGHFLALRTKYRMPIWLGESGENTNDWFRECVGLVEKYQVGWAWWPHKKLFSPRCIMTVTAPDDFKKVVDYWNGEGERPSRESARRGLFELVENLKAEKCRYNADVAQALIPGATTAPGPSAPSVK
jgi:carboxylesterase type B